MVQDGDVTAFKMIHMTEGSFFPTHPFASLKLNILFVFPADGHDKFKLAKRTHTHTHTNTSSNKTRGICYFQKTESSWSPVV